MYSFSDVFESPSKQHHLDLEMEMSYLLEFIGWMVPQLCLLHLSSDSPQSVAVQWTQNVFQID